MSNYFLTLMHFIPALKDGAFVLQNGKVRHGILHPSVKQGVEVRRMASGSSLGGHSLAQRIDTLYADLGMPDHGIAEASRHGIARSNHWPAVEHAFRAAHPHCACCTHPIAGITIQVHHKFPFHYCVALGRPDLELDPRNLISLCETETKEEGANHHLLIGHLDDFRSSNLTVEEDATKTFHGMQANAIRRDVVWQKKVSNKLKPLDEMTQADKAAFVKLMNDTYPKQA